jgi:hypothetical protein
LADIVDYMADRKGLFPVYSPLAKKLVLTPEESQEIRDLWGRFLDYQLMLDASWQHFGEKENEQDKPEGAAHFILW